MKIEVTVKSIQEQRPSGHTPSALFAGGINYKETIWCPHTKEHAGLFIKVFDLSAEKCGMERQEFQIDEYFITEMDKLAKAISDLHVYLVKKGKRKGFGGLDTR